MSDIFISYARRDRETAQRLAQALEAQGWSVWWDYRLLFGVLFRHVIERELAAARCVVVLWSEAAVQSNWVLDEANKGLERQILVPVRLENVRLPLPFGEIQTGDMSDWNGQETHPHFRQMVASVTAILPRPRVRKENMAPIVKGKGKDNEKEQAKPDNGQARPPQPCRRKIIVTAITILLLTAMPFTLLLVMGWRHPMQYSLSWSALQMHLKPESPPVVASPLNPVLKFHGHRRNDTAVRLDKELSKRFEIDTGTRIHINPHDEEDRLNMLIRMFGEQSDAFDVFMIDIIWVHELADHLIDFHPHFDENETLSHDRVIIDNNTVEGNFVAVPWFQNIGLLFYRQDLLERYREDFKEIYRWDVPRTWEDLEKVAAKIQARQREENNSQQFIGFAWQGERYEGLTCNALEWIASEGALDANTNLPLFEHSGVLDALDRARGWVKGENPISPYVRHHKEEESLQRFLNGNAAFHRGWSNEYAMIKQSGIPFGVAPLPVPERRRGAKSRSVLGGWQLAVPKYSRNQSSAIEFVRYLSSPEVQEWRAKAGGYQPTNENVIKAIDVKEALPFLNDGQILNIEPIIRPSNQPGNRYNQVSECIYLSVDAALTRNSREEIKQDIEEMKNCVERASNPDLPDDVPYDPYSHVP